MSEQTTANPAPNLFTPEAMVEIQASVLTKLKEDYLKDNFIPEEVSVPPNLFVKVMDALVQGFGKSRTEVMFFDAQKICTIVQITAPTMFIRPDIAAAVDSAMFKMLKQYDIASVALMEYASIRFEMQDNGTVKENPTTAEILIFKQIFEKECTQYSHDASASLALLRDARYWNRYNKYNTAELIKHIFNENASLVNRDEFSSEFQEDDSSRIDDSDPVYMPPPILGLDVLQLLASITEENNSMTDVALAALMVIFGQDALMVSNKGEVTITETYSKEVREALYPHRKWFKIFLNISNPVKAVSGQYSFNSQCDVTLTDNPAVSEDGTCL